MNRVLRTAAASCVCLFVAACGGGAGQTVTNVQQNSTPTGFVEGRVVDAATGAPIANAVVNTYANGNVSATTDEAGRYRLGPIPAGSSYTLFVQLEGYVKRMFFIGINGSAGNYPVGNVVVTQDLEMSAANAGVEGQVLTNTGRAAVNASVYLDLRDDNYDLIVTAKTDMAGKFKLTGLPSSAGGLNVNVIVPPFDDNGDGAPDYNQGSRNLNLYPGYTSPAVVNLNALSLQVATSSLSSGEISPSDAITFEFTTPIDTATADFSLVQNGGGYEVAVNATWTGNTKVTLTPVGGPLAPNMNYYVFVELRALNGSSFSNSYNFNVRGTTTVPTGTVTNFKITSPGMMMYDSQLSVVNLSWDPMPMVGGYKIYVRSEKRYQSYLLLRSMNASQTNESIYFSTFDSDDTDDYNTPLGNSNKVKFVIVPTDSQGNHGPLDTAASIEINDTVLPRLTSGSQNSGSANNTSGTMPSTVTYVVYFSEPMLFSATPAITLPAMVTAKFQWNNEVQGTYTLTIPAGVNGTGAVTVNGAKDTSNNVQTMMHSGNLY